MLTKRDRVALPWTDTLARLEDERIMLQRIAAGMPLAEVLEHVLHAIEAQSSVELRTSIALVDESGGFLVHGAAPSLPAAYNSAVHKAVIGPDSASWGEAAYTGSPVYVEDIALNPGWARWRDLALSHGLRACWSTPIKAPDGRLLGVFSNYYGVVRSPSAHDIDAIALVTRSAALAIERHLTELALRQSGERWRAMFAGMQEAFFLSEALRDDAGRIVDFRFLEVNPAFERQTGMKEGDTPSWFFFLPTGGNDPSDPTKPGWGGRFEKEADGWFRDAKSAEDPRLEVSRWRPAFQADFAKRMAWCVP